MRAVRLRIRKFFFKKKVFLILSAFIILAILAYSFSFMKFSSFFTFKKYPFLSDDRSIVNFVLNSFPNDNLVFSIDGYGAKVNHRVNEFCNGKKCAIPLFIGGVVNFSILNRDKLLYNKIFDLPELNFSCTSPNWEDRMCRAKNVCFNAGLFAITSPFPIEFDMNMLTLGARTPPTDFSLSRISNRFKTQYCLPPGVPFMKNRSHLISIYHFMEREWYLYFDLLLPTFFTLTKEKASSLNDLRNNHLFFQYDLCRNVPHIISSLSKNRLMCLNRPFCFEDLVFGMDKITNNKLNEKDPPYDFTNKNMNISLFKDAIYEFFSIDQERYEEKAKENKKNVLIVQENILNIKNLKQVVEKIFSKDNISFINFNEASVKEQILAVRDVDILIGTHQDTLSNILWMKKGSTVVEILPYKFTCCDWIARASKFLNINYLSFNSMPLDYSLLKKNDVFYKCIFGNLKCSSSECFNKLQDQNVKIDLDSFEKNLTSYLNHQRSI